MARYGHLVELFTGEEPGVLARPSGGNRFLAALPESSRARLLSRATRARVRLRETIQRQGEPLQHVIFPLSGIVSIVHQTSDGGLAEVGLVGNEGFAGIGTLLGARRAIHALVAQADGEFVRVDTETFVEECRHSDSVLGLAQRFALAHLESLGITVACNALHPADRRLARWILRMDDRVGAGEVTMTQDIAALLLGVRRATVTRAISLVAATGAIAYERGLVRIRNRTALEASACSCYGELRAAVAAVYASAT